MEQSRSKRDSQIAELARQIISLCQGVTTTAESPGVSLEAERSPSEIAAMVANGVCLNCGKPLEDAGAVRRGLDTGCYYEVKRLVDSKQITDSQAVSAGLWLAKTKGGRPKATERAGSAAERYMNRLREVHITATVAHGVSAANSHLPAK